MTFILSEDKALRDKLLGMTVSDKKAGTTRPVGVWFGQPDLEIRDQAYPYVTVDLIDVSEDRPREMRGFAKPDYMEVDGLTNQQDWKIRIPVPVNLDYQVTTYARQPYHDREILGQLLGQKLPIRFGTLEPEDGTVRRLDVLDVAKRDQTEQGKRLFMNAITVRVSSELPVENIQVLQKVLQVNVSGPTQVGYFGDSFTITQPTGTP